LSPTHWTISASGMKIVLDPEAPDFDPGAFTLHDVATHLSRQARYNGAVDWSVAAHSVLAASLATADNQPREIIRAVLMHDGHEAYVGDVISPVRRVVGEPWQSYEDKFQAAFLRAMGLEADKSAEVRVYDLLALSCEKQHFFDDRHGYTDWGGRLPSVSSTQREVAWALLSHRVSRETWAQMFYSWGAMLGFPTTGRKKVPLGRREPHQIR